MLGLIPGLPRVVLDPELVFLFFLPPLLYPAALFTSWRDFRANLRPIFLLAVGLVLFTIVSVGFLAHYFVEDFPLAAGFVLGAIISPPDAIAAMAIASRLGLPRRIITILEGESLVNDATALVALRFAVASAATGTFSLSHASGQFLYVSLGGVLLGLAVGYITFRIQKPIDDPPIEITLSLLTPFVSYLSAEQFGVSGVLAVVSTGLYHGWRIPEFTTSRTRLQAAPVWEMVEFLLNGFIFLLIGLQVPEILRHLAHRSLPQLFWYAFLISVAVIVLRIIWVFPATYLPRLIFRKMCARDPYPNWRHVTIVAWTGMRGVVSLAAALALPEKFPGRDLILFLTFTVILATLVIQGLSLPSIIRALGIKDDRATAREEREARLRANQAAVARLEEIARSTQNSPEALLHMRAEYEDRIKQLQNSDEETDDLGHGLYSASYEALARDTLKVERSTILQLRNEEIINDEVLRRIQKDIDLAEARLRRHRD